MKRFQGIYWQHFALTSGLVLLTLLMLGTSFFTLTYTYIMSEKKSELEEKAELVAELTQAYTGTDSVYGGILGERNQGRQVIAQVAASLSDIDFLIWDTESNTMLTTDPSLEGMEIRLPENVTERVFGGRTFSGMSDLNIYSGRKYVVGVPMIHTNLFGEETVQGMVLAVTETHTLTEMWRTFLGLFGITLITVILIAFVASSVAAMRQTKPIKEIAEATKRFASGDFATRVNDYGREDEIGELAASFNAMADSLQRTELQRREFVANISHELKTPMTTITGYAEGILDGTIAPEQEDHYLRIISGESRRLNRLVRRMLEVSQLQSIDMLKKAPFDICESMLRVLVSMEKKITDRDLDVEVEIPEESLMVLGDNDLITQVIYNLLENAAKFARPGTALRLELKLRGEKAEVAIRNLGETIPAEEIPRLFDRFHKTDKSRSEDKDGVGLGLYIVKTILDQHGEQIRVTSEEGETSFVFTMTVASENGMNIHER